MTQKPKKPLSKLYFLVLFSFLVPLAGFFVYATRNPIAYFFLAAALLADIFLLIAFHSRLQKKQSQISLLKEEYFEKANLLKAELQDEWETIASLRLKIINYAQLKDLTEKLSMCLSLEDTSSTLSAEVSKLFALKDVTVILYLFHSATGELGISSSQKGQMQVNLKAKKGDIFDQFVVKTLHPLIVEDVQTDFRFDLDKMEGEDKRQLRSLISTPLIVGDKTLGILRLDSGAAHQFSTDDLRFLRTIADLTSIAIENAQLYERLETMAIKDGLTGLYLRRHMLERLQEEISRELRRGRDLSFLMVDLDRFKQYNDSFGHMAGDIVLKTIAQLLEEYFKHPGELVCRYGGEEFCVVLPDCPKAKAVQLANELRKKVEAREIILRRQKTHVTVSIGVASFPKDAQGNDDLIFKADEAMYQAKETWTQQGVQRMIYILIISTVVFVGVVFYLAQLVVLGLEQRADEDVLGAKDVFGKIIDQRDKAHAEKAKLEREAMQIFTLYDMTKEITRHSNEQDAFNIFFRKLKENVIIEDCQFAQDIGEGIKGGTLPSDYAVFVLRAKEKKLGVLLYKGLESKDKEKFAILAHQFALALRRMRLYKDIETLAITDGLTGVYTRRYFIERFEEEIKRATLRKSSLSLLMIDADHFKMVNDQHGHLAGDQVLKEITNIIQENVREIDIVGRFGGEEFCVVLPDTDMEASRLVAERIRKSAEKRLIKAYDSTLRVTLSIGLAVYPPDGKLVEELMDKADWALYRAKSQGRNCVVAFGLYQDKK